MLSRYIIKLSSKKQLSLFKPRKSSSTTSILYLIIISILSLNLQVSTQTSSIEESSSSQQNTLANTSIQNSNDFTEQITSTTKSPIVIINESGIDSAIKQFDSRPNDAGDSLTSSDFFTPTRSDDNKQQSTIVRKQIRSRYRSRVAQQQDQQQLANYSQPFDLPPIQQQQEAGSYYQQQQPSLGRALKSGTPGYVNHLPASYSYMPAAPSALAQRAAQSGPVTTGLAGSGESGQSGLFLEEPSAYNQDSLLDYTAPLHAYAAGSATSRMHYVAGQPQQSLGRMRMNNNFNTNEYLHTAAGEQQSPQHYFMSASPSMNSFDYYGAGSMEHPAHIGSASSIASSSIDNSNMDNYEPISGRNSNNLHHSLINNANNLTESSTSYGSSSSLPYYGSLSSAHYPFDFTNNYGLPNYSPGSSLRSRWSWPWTDVSQIGYNSHHHHANNNPITAATFKKHYHHHHHVPKEHHSHHKEHEHHDHHEEHDHMSKWEHGISIGEIACIAVAVVLGIIILGSPFFLLFLMLFNGGNLFGTTQMGLLAPAGAAAAPAAAAGRRRRKRSIHDSNHNSLSSKLAQSAGLSKEELDKLKEMDLNGIGEYLFDRLSPYLNPDKLMRSFGRMMDVKDDIDKIIEKLGAQKTFNANKLVNNNEQSDEGHHDEMRRRRKK